MSNPLEEFEAGGAETPSFRVPAEMPVLPLRDTVLFPQAFMPLAERGTKKTRIRPDRMVRLDCSRGQPSWGRLPEGGSYKGPAVFRRSLMFLGTPGC